MCAVGFVPICLMPPWRHCLPNNHCVRQAFDALGFEEVTFVVGKDHRLGMFGHRVHFYVKDTLISQEEYAFLTKKMGSQKISPRWDRHGLDSVIHDKKTKEEMPLIQYKSEFLKDCLHNKSFSMRDLRAFLLSKDSITKCFGPCVKYLKEA